MKTLNTSTPSRRPLRALPTARCWLSWARLVPAALLALGSAAASAQAAPATFDTCFSDRNGLNGPLREARSCANASAVGSYGSANYGIGNGRSDTSRSGDGTGATQWAEQGWANRAMASTGSGGNVWASSDLTTGRLRGVAETGWVSPLRGGVQGYAFARMGDVLTLVNQTGSDQVLSLGYSFDGGFVGAGGDDFNYGYVHLGMDSTSGLKLAQSGHWIGSSMTTHFEADGDYRQEYFNGTDADHSFSRFGDARNGVFGGTASVSFILPPGESDLALSFVLSVSCRVFNSSCDFGNTSSLAFSPLPTGVSYRSQSGVFLSGLAAPVPEPSSAAFMLAGLAGLVAVAKRRNARD